MAQLGRSFPFQFRSRTPLGALQTTVVFEAAATSTYEAALSTYSFNITVGTQASRMLVVGVSIFAAGSVTGVTADGVAMAFIRSDTNGIYRSELWYLAAPHSGVIAIAVTLNAALTSIANAQSYYNADPVLDANNGGNGTNTPASAAVVTVAATCTVVGNLAAQTATGVTSAAGQYSRTTSAGALGTGASDDFGDVIPAGSKTLTWNNIGVVDSWAVSLVSLQPPAAAAPDTLFAQALM